MVSYRELAAHGNVSISAVQYAEKKGHLTRIDGKFALEHPSTIAQLERWNTTPKRGPRQYPPGEYNAKDNTPKTQSNGGQPVHSIEQPQLYGDRNALEIAKLRAQLEAMKMKNEKERGDLVKGDVCDAILRSIFNIESTELLTLGSRLAPELSAIFEVNDPAKAIKASGLIDAEVQTALDHIKAVILRFLDEYPIKESAATTDGIAAGFDG